MLKDDSLAWSLGDSSLAPKLVLLLQAKFWVLQQHNTDLILSTEKQYEPKWKLKQGEKKR